MSQPRIPPSLRIAARERARGCCEYCQMPETGTFFAHEVDHIIALQHGGKTTLKNLALACIQCNRLKGPNIASMDPQTRSIVPLFNPRADRLAEHFRTAGGQIIPLTPAARATATLLDFGNLERVEARNRLWEATRPAG